MKIYSVKTELKYREPADFETMLEEREEATYHMGRGRRVRGGRLYTALMEGEELAAEITDSYEANDGKAVAFIKDCKRNSDIIEGFVVTLDDRNPENVWMGFFDKILEALPGYELVRNEIKDETIENLSNSIRKISRKFCVDMEEVMSNIGLNDVVDRFENGEICDSLVEANEGYEKLCEKARKLWYGESLIEELDRIYEKNMPKTKRPKNVMGIPAHYIVEVDSYRTAIGVAEILASALYENGRLKIGRLSDVVFTTEVEKRPFGLPSKGGVGPRTMSRLYSINEGAAVCSIIHGADIDDGEFATNQGERIVKFLSDITKAYKNDTVSIICIDSSLEGLKKSLYQELGNTRVVEISPTLATNDEAKNVLKMLAKEKGVRANASLLNKIKLDYGYNQDELETMFDDWFAAKVANEYYPQYSGFRSICEKAANSVKGSAYDELMGMIGLNNVKTITKDALDYFKAQKLFRDKGMSVGHNGMHMVFTGNPGTAKTSVARLIAQVMKENGILSTGNFVEVGRADLVGMYVGHTAPRVKNAFVRAKGGVLFIDEAYSLLDDRKGMFGDEAINTIVQEMENHRDDVIVIFAGYPDEMKAFLERNPGLNSRIAYHVNFDDYTADELLQIASHIANRDNISIDSGAEAGLIDLFSKARLKRDYGNGRFARNIIEMARKKQAARLVKMDYDDVTCEMIGTLIAEDFAGLEIDAPEEAKTFGFVS